MTDKEINEAVARKCGWEKAHELGIGNGVPDYCSDLNAMHEAEKVLDGKPHSSGQDAQFAYAGFVYGITVPMEQQPFRATARQRAEAFLRTFDLWKD